MMSLVELLKSKNQEDNIQMKAVSGSCAMSVTVGMEWQKYTHGDESVTGHIEFGIYHSRQFAEGMKVAIHPQ